MNEGTFILRLAVVCVVALGYLGLIGLGLWVVYFLLTLPMRRTERARLSLDILELGMAEGHSPEASIVRAADSRDRSLGVRFYLLAAYIRQGRTLASALELVPRIVPPEVTAMLKAGETMGNVRLVLPACRKLLGDSVAQVHSALNYLLLVTFAFAPAAVAIPFILRTNVFPKYKQIFSELLASDLPRFAAVVFDTMGLIALCMALLYFVIWVLTAAYIGGPRVRSFLRRFSPLMVDGFLYAVPWRRKRMQRDFSHLLSLLLDGGVAEREAVRLAANAVDNRVVRNRAERVEGALAQGVPLSEGIRCMDDTREMGWRLSNAIRSGRGFAQALSGWHESLDARADREEQAAAQLASSGLVLLNGVLIGLIATAVFMALVQITQEGLLW